MKKNWSDELPSPYDLSEIAKQRLHQRFREGYVPKRGSPYDLHHAWVVRQYYEGKWRR